MTKFKKWLRKNHIEAYKFLQELDTIKKVNKYKGYKIENEAEFEYWKFAYRSGDLILLFIWMTTPQGSEFWEDIYSKWWIVDKKFKKGI